MRKLSVDKTNIIISHLKEHKSANQVSSLLHVSRVTIQKITKKAGIILQDKSPGLPCSLSQRAQHSITHKIQSGQVNTAVEAQKNIVSDLGIDVSVETVRRSLRKAGMRSAPKVKKPFLSQHHRKIRLEFAKVTRTGLWKIGKE